jgi:glutaredoxin 3
MKPVEIYVKEDCAACARARQLLMLKGALFREIDITFAEDRRQEMLERTGGRTETPQVFIGGEFIGNYDALKTLEERGELDRKLSWTGDPDDLRQNRV